MKTRGVFYEYFPEEIIQEDNTIAYAVTPKLEKNLKRNSNKVQYQIYVNLDYNNCDNIWTTAIVYDRNEDLDYEDIKI